MAGWLRAAANALGRGAPEVPEATPFQSHCRCGGMVSGLRRPTHQVVRCRECGESLFILPVDVYPRSKPKKPPPPSEAQPPRPQTPLAAETPDPTDWEIPREASHSSRAGAGSRKNGSSSGAGEAKATPETLLVLPGAQRRTRVRILAVLIFSLLMATGLTMRRAQLREEAETLLRTRSETVDRLLAEGAGLPLEEELARHVEALRRLGRDDDSASRTRALYRESMALNRLATVGLLDLIAEAEKSIPLGSVEWDGRFDLIHRGRWIIIDAPIVRSTDETGAETWVADVPLEGGAHSVRLIADLEIFERMPESEFSTPLLLAAQLDACRLPTADRPAIEIVLAPETGFLWERAETLPMIGLVEADPMSAEAMVRRLTRQKRLADPPSEFLIAEMQKSGLPKRIAADDRGSEERNEHR